MAPYRRFQLLWRPVRPHRENPNNLATYELGPNSRDTSGQARARDCGRLFARFGQTATVRPSTVSSPLPDRISGPTWIRADFNRFLAARKRGRSSPAEMRASQPIGAMQNGRPMRARASQQPYATSLESAPWNGRGQRQQPACTSPPVTMRGTPGICWPLRAPADARGDSSACGFVKFQFSLFGCGQVELDCPNNLVAQLLHQLAFILLQSSKQHSNSTTATTTTTQSRHDFSQASGSA